MINQTALLRYVFILLLVFLVILLPSWNMPKLMHGTLSGKYFFFVYWLIGGALVFVAYKGFQRNINIHITPIDILLFVLLGYILINRYLIQQHYGFSFRFYELVGLAIFYIILRNLPPNHFQWLLLAIVFGGIIQAVYGNLQLYGYCPSHHSVFKMTGSFFNPGPYAGFLASVFSVALGIYLFRSSIFKVPYSKFKVHGPKFGTRNPKPGTIWKYLEPPKDWSSQIEAIIKYGVFKYIPLIGIITILLVIPASRSRAAWLAVLVSSGFLLTVRYGKGIKQKFFQTLDTRFKKLIAGFIIIMLIGGGLFGMYKMKQDSANGRQLVWQVTINIIKDNPVFGVGFDLFKAHYMNYQADYFKANPESEYVMVAGDLNYAYNELLQFTSEEGLIGLLIVLILIIFLIKGTDKKDFFQIIAWAGLISIITFSMFSYPVQIMPIKIIIVTMLVLIVNIIQHYKYTLRLKLFERNSVFNYLIKGMMTSGVVIGLFLSWKHNNLLYKGYDDWQSTYNAYKLGMYEASLEEYEKIYPIFSRNGEFLQHYGKALSMMENHKKALLVLQQAQKYYNTRVIQLALGNSYESLEQYADAETAYRIGYYMVPNRFYVKYQLAKLYDNTGQSNKAVMIATELLEKDVKVNSIAINKIRAKMRKLLEKYSKMSSS